MSAQSHASVPSEGSNDRDLIPVCRVEEVPPGEARYVEHRPPIALFNVDGVFHATSDTCTHAESSLSDGYIDGAVVECALHMARFSIIDGSALCFPATRPLQVFAVRVIDGVVYVDPAAREGSR